MALESLDESRGDVLLNFPCEEVVLLSVFIIDDSDANDAVVLGEPDADGAAAQDLLQVSLVPQRVAVALGIVPEVGAVEVAVGDDVPEVGDEVVPLVGLGEAVGKDVGVSD